jgi:hypothetical protein
MFDILITFSPDRVEYPVFAILILELLPIAFIDQHTPFDRYINKYVFVLVIIISLLAELGPAQITIVDL